MWSDSRYVLEVEPMGFSVGLDVGLREGSRVGIEETCWALRRHEGVLEKADSGGDRPGQELVRKSS